MCKCMNIRKPVLEMSEEDKKLFQDEFKITIYEDIKSLTKEDIENIEFIELESEEDK